MAANTKYQVAPQRDSLEEPNYTQAPPSYQAEASRDTLLGQPRSENDNVPDDFKVSRSCPEFESSLLTFGSSGALWPRLRYLSACSLSAKSIPSCERFPPPYRRQKLTFSSTVQILATMALSSVSYWSTSYKNWIRSNAWMMWVSLFGAIGFMLLTFWKRKSYPTNLFFLSGFTALEAYSISVIVSFYKTKIVLEALIITSAIFVALTIFACQTKYDFTSWMPYLFGGLWILIIFGFMAAFFPYSSTVELVYGAVAALIFSGYILVDTQLVMRHYHVEEEIAAAISLYLDIINLFLAILRILNSQQNN